MLFVLIGAIFSPMIKIRNLFRFCSHRCNLMRMAVINIIGKRVVVVRVNLSVFWLDFQFANLEKLH